jgi:5'-nucleotidase/UDP-sugar diphosphatase
MTDPHTRRRWKPAILFLVLLLLAPACTIVPVSTLEEPLHHLVVLHTNDHHGHPVKFPHGPAENAGGLPARASLIQKIRKENANVLLLDAGDLNTGRSESNLFKAKPDIEGYNYLGYDAMVLGNHEFDRPLAVLRQQMAYARFPFLCSNLRTKDGVPFAQSHIIKAFPGFKVAVFGLTLKEASTLAAPINVQDLVFEDEIETARALVPRLKQEADLVIGLTHLGIFDSPHHGSIHLASQVDGIDVIVDGHTHTRIESPIVVRNPSGAASIIVQAWKWGLLLGRLDLWIQGGKVKDYRFEAIPINLWVMQRNRQGAMVHGPPQAEIPEDPTLLNLLQPYADEAESRLSEVIASLDTSLSSSHARNEEAEIGNLVADSMQWFSSRWGADFAVLNGGSIRHDLPAGPVSIKSIYDMLPFDNSIVLLTLEGSDVIRLFDFIATIRGGSGAFPQFSSGLSVVLDPTARKVGKVLIKGAPIDMNRSYKIATNSYLAGGGDGYKVFLDAREKFDTAALQQPVLIEYIKAMGGRLSPQLDGRITIRP